MTSPRDRSDGETGLSRRTMLQSVGAVGGMWTLGGTGSRSYVDQSGNGIPDRKTRSKAVHDRLESLFGADQFEGFDPGRRDLLLDVRYVRGTSIHPTTKRVIVDQFRTRGIYAQWLEYPETYDRTWMERRYGWSTRALLWGRNSFYQTEVEPDLKNLAIQLFVIPGRSTQPYEGLVYSPTMNALGGGRDGHVYGFSVGNRALVTDRDDLEHEVRLVLHEIAHYGLCHDDDPRNTGVMGRSESASLMDHEWERLRNSLHNVYDTTGYDILARPCLWEECLTDVLNTVGDTG